MGGVSERGEEGYRKYTGGTEYMCYHVQQRVTEYIMSISVIVCQRYNNKEKECIIEPTIAAHNRSSSPTCQQKSPIHM